MLYVTRMFLDIIGNDRGAQLMCCFIEQKRQLKCWFCI